MKLKISIFICLAIVLSCGQNEIDEIRCEEIKLFWSYNQDKCVILYWGFRIINKNTIDEILNKIENIDSLAHVSDQNKNYELHLEYSNGDSKKIKLFKELKNKNPQSLEHTQNCITYLDSLTEVYYPELNNLQLLKKNKKTQEKKSKKELEKPKINSGISKDSINSKLPPSSHLHSSSLEWNDCDTINKAPIYFTAKTNFETKVKIISFVSEIKTKCKLQLKENKGNVVICVDKNQNIDYSSHIRLSNPKDQKELDKCISELIFELNTGILFHILTNPRNFQKYEHKECHSFPLN